jgi:hypothetical protein
MNHPASGLGAYQEPLGPASLRVRSRAAEHEGNLMSEQEIREAHPDWSDEQVAAEVARLAEAENPEPAKQESVEGEKDTVTLSKKEVDALRRQLAEAGKKQRKIEADAKKAEEERQRQDGNWQRLAEEKTRELESERAEKSRIEREQRVTRIATRMKFLDPADVLYRVPADDGADDALTEAALERIAKGSPHLISKESPKPEIGKVLEPTAAQVAADSGPKPPAGKAPLTSVEDVKKLTEQEINDRWDEVQAVMSQAA